LTARDVVDALKLTTDRLSVQTLDAMPAAVRDLYARHGFLDARVSVERKRLAKPGTAKLAVRVAPGEQVAIVGVSFGGARHFSQELLTDQLQSYLEEDLPGGDLLDTVDPEVFDEVALGDAPAQRQVPKPMAEEPAQTYYAPTYTEALKHITELYQADGYLDVKVGPPSLDRVGPTRATVTIPVVEGPRTLLYSVVLTGQEHISDRDLLIASGLSKSQPFSYLLLEEARLRIQNAYQEQGYMFVKIEPSVRFSRDRTRAEVAFQIIERFPVRIGEIQVRGAERTSPTFIKSLLELHEGDLFTPSKARESADTVQTLGVFTGVSVEMGEPDLPARVKPLVVTVNERKNQFLDFSAGLSTGQGIRGGFEYGYRNLFDHAVGLTLRVNLAYQLFFVQKELRDRFDALPLQRRLERNISLGTVIPRTPGLGATRTNLDLVHVRDNERDFGLDKNGITLAFTEVPLKRVTVVEAADLENNNIDLFESRALNDYLATTTDPRLRRLLRVPEGNTTLVALRSTLSYDQRDSPFVPTHGFYVSGSGELASTLASETVDTITGKTQFVSRFLKLQVTGSGYLPLGKKVVLAGQLRVGRIVHLIHDSKTYPNRAFFLGGVDTMRAYFQDELVPQDIADKIITDPKLSPNTIVRSGDAFVLAKGELRFPIYGELGGGLFTDLGNLWADAKHINPFDLRPTAGAGLRLATPVGPIAVDYGIVLKRRRGLGEPFGTLQFSIGLF
ncbi:MAG TPA: BamA/TamA family outer membrane protein, partial [Polyangiales bacterium]|nr:BamA/TamA family outer membrane protein [Polyangiales bacterium]